MKDILNSYSVSELRKLISSTNIKGYSKMKKSELINLMVKKENIDKFKNVKSKTKPAPKPKKKEEKEVDFKVPDMSLRVRKTKDVKPKPKKKEEKEVDFKVPDISLRVRKTKDVKPKPKPKKKEEKDCLAKRSGQPTKPKDRKDFFKQSLKFHPDKNPDCKEYATEMFAKLNNLHTGKTETGKFVKDYKISKSNLFSMIPPYARPDKALIQKYNLRNEYSKDISSDAGNVKKYFFRATTNSHDVKIILKAPLKARDKKQVEDYLKKESKNKIQKITYLF
jgi:hypothetical protein